MTKRGVFGCISPLTTKQWFVEINKNLSYSGASFSRWQTAKINQLSYIAAIFETCTSWPLRFFYTNIKNEESLKK